MVLTGSKRLVKVSLSAVQPAKIPLILQALNDFNLKTAP